MLVVHFCFLLEWSEYAVVWDEVSPQGSVRRCVACLKQGSPWVVQGSMELEILLSQPPKMCQPVLTLIDLGSKMLYFGFEHIISFPRILLRS